MRRLMMLAGLALAASLVLAGVASASASAAEILLNGTNGFPQLILGLGGNVSTLSSAHATIECNHLLIHGLIYSSKDILLLLLWHECKEKGTGTACNSPNEPAGSKNIHDAVLLLPVLLLNNLPGLLIHLDLNYSKNTGEVNCGLVKITVRGTVLGHIAFPANETFSNKMTLDILIKTSTEQLWTDTAEKPNEIDHLESNSGFGFEAATEQVVGAETHFVNTGVEAKFEG